MKPFAVLLLALISFTAFSQTKNFIDQPYVEVTGTAEMEVVPDEIYLKIILDDQKIKGKEDLALVEKQMYDRLNKIGIDVSKQLSISDFSGNFKDYWLKSSGVKSVKEFQLKVNDAKTAGAVFREMTEIGVTRINIDRLDHSEIEKLKGEVKVLAIKAAKSKAESLTKAIDQPCGKAIYIQEMNHQIINPMQRNSMGFTANVMMNAEMVSDPDIEFEKIKLSYSILVRFALP